MRYGLAALAVGALASLGGCGSSPPALTAAEQFAGMCPTKSSDLNGKKQPGDKCSSAEECAPFCCTCPTGTKTFLAASCMNGVCDTMANACANNLAADNSTSGAFCD